jgi:subtilisin family serine protease
VRRQALRRRLGALALFIAMLALAAPAPAAAVQCNSPASAYSSGGPARSGFPNDPLYPKQWGLTQIHAPAAWARGARGDGVVIAVVDSGADFSHPDLRAKLLPGTDLTRAHQDSNGNSVPAGGRCPGAQDEEGHGTHVAGIAAAITDNGIGVAGTAPGARILPVRVLDEEGSATPETVNAGIRWAADHGARVINLSLGDTPLVDMAGGAAATDQAVAYAWSKGAVIVAAAGNEAFAACDYPAAAKNAVCVGATDSNGAPAAYSNFPNDPGGTVGVRAPGGSGAGMLFCDPAGDVWSTIWPASLDDCGLKGYATEAGTSMSAPFVSGVAAMLAGRGLTNAQILECLKSTSRNPLTGTVGGYDPAYGSGIVDADAATARCRASTTANFGGNGNVGGGGAHVKVHVAKTSRKQIEKKGKLTVTVSSDRPATVKLAAVVRSKGKATTDAKRTVKFKAKGKKKAVLTLSSKARKRYAASKSSKVVVNWRAGSAHGSVAPGH